MKNNFNNPILGNTKAQLKKTLNQNKDYGWKSITKGSLLSEILKKVVDPNLNNFQKFQG